MSILYIYNVQKYLHIGSKFSLCFSSHSKHLKDRRQALFRRGLARVDLGQLAEGVGDMKLASKLSPEAGVLGIGSATKTYFNDLS